MKAVGHINDSLGVPVIGDQGRLTPQTNMTQTFRIFSNSGIMYRTRHCIRMMVRNTNQLLSHDFKNHDDHESDILATCICF